MTIGEKLKRLRGKKSQRVTAAEIGISKSALAMYEKDRRIPRDETKKQIADYYGVSILELFF